MSTGRYIAAYAGFVAAMHVVDGPWQRWTKGKTVDMWTLTHVAWGAVARRMRVPFGTFMLLAATNEVVEWWVRENRPDMLWGTPESRANVAMDLVTNAAGYLLTPERV